MEKKKIKLTNIRQFVVFLSSFFIFLLLFSSAAGYFYVRYQIFTSFDKCAGRRDFIIEQGQSLKQIAYNLEKEGFIKDDFWFLVYAVFKNLSLKMQAGDYSLSPSMNVSEMAVKIASGDAIVREKVVTILGGLTLKEIEEKLVEAKLIESGELLKYPELEGFLFPDTYRFSTDSTVEDIIQKMRDNFDEQVDQSLRDEIEKQGKTLGEVVTMASIIEKEVPTYYEKRIVSGVFWKRISVGYPLQSCATLAYALGVRKWRFSIEDTKIDSPYNTYQNKGLPPGPINNPGIWSIKAAIWPTPTDYFFFLSTRDGQTIFSRTAEEHNTNKAKYLD